MAHLVSREIGIIIHRAPTRTLVDGQASDTIRSAFIKSTPVLKYDQVLVYTSSRDWSPFSKTTATHRTQS